MNKIFLLFFFMSAACELFALGPTVAENGEFLGISTFQIVRAKIRGKLERVCLPKIEFEDDADKKQINTSLQEELVSQKAVFNLYHDGLGRPKKDSGMYFASDIFLKSLNISYITYLKRAFRAKVAKEPAFNDQSFVIKALYAEEGTKFIAKIDKIKKKAEERKEKERLKPSNMRVVTIYDMLPPGVLPLNIRKINKEVNRRLARLKSRAYDTEIVQIDPLRWASGVMGVMNENGEINGSTVEGQRVMLAITPPAQKGALTSKLLNKIKNQPCEFIFFRLKNGLEAKENGRYRLRDIYFKNLRLSWEELLAQENIPYVMPEHKAEYTDGVIALGVQKVSGTFKGVKAPVLCLFEFDKNELAGGKEVCRVFPPKPRPKSFKSYFEVFDKNFVGALTDVSLLVCPDGQAYRELGQLRVLRAKFKESNLMLDSAQKMVVSGQLK